MKISGATWFTMFNGLVVGIVTGETPEGVRKAYIGVSPPDRPGAIVPDEQGDADYIAKNGGKVRADDLRRIADYLDGGKREAH